jgi:hypothetical protein
MGNEGDLRTGGAQWMRAGSGVIHSEMPRQSEGLMRGFQLWINLPASEKMADPLYQEIAPRAIPQAEREGARVKVLAGEFGGLRGPIEDPHTGLQYLDVALDPGWAFRHALEGDLAVLLYVFEGDLRGAGRALPAHHLAVLGPGDSLEVQASGTGARFILVAGRPIGEPIVQRGPFVMNTREEIEEALADYRDGRLVRRRAAVTGP